MDKARATAGVPFQRKHSERDDSQTALPLSRLVSDLRMVPSQPSECCCKGAEHTTQGATLLAILKVSTIREASSRLSRSLNRLQLSYFVLVAMGQQTTA